MLETFSGQHATQDKMNGSSKPSLTRLTPNSRIWLVTVLTFLLFVLLGTVVVVIVENNRLQARQKVVTDISARIADNINDHLTRSLSATYALAAVIHQNNGVIENFEQLANEMLELYGGISSLQLAPKGIISAIVPLAGNEKAIGHNLLEDTKRNKEALLAIRTRKLTLAGPFELIQGGRAIIGRLPVFPHAADGTEYFWGFTAVMIRIPEFISSVNMQKIVEAGYNFELSRLHPDTSKQDIFARSIQTELRSPIDHIIEVPNDTWVLSIEPVKGWFSPLVITCEVILVLLVSSLITMMMHTFYKQPVILRRMVDERTRQLSEANQKLTSEIEERERAEEDLRESNDRYRQLYVSMEQGMALHEIICDDNGCPTDYRFLVVNPSFERIVGLSKEQIIGRTALELFPDLESHWIETYGRVALTGEAITFENYTKPLDRHYQVYAYCPRIGQFAVLVNDITERMRSDEERRRLEVQMQHAQKLESLGVLAGGIAHDFNNILLAILGNAELAMMRLNPVSPARDNLLRIEQAAKRAAELSRQMLAYSGKGKFIVEAIDLGELVTEMIHMLEVSISKKAILRFDLATNLPPVEADATQLRQVLMNLVINASEAIGDKSGVIAISTGAMQCDRTYLSRTWINEQLEEGLYVYVEVADTGCGMDRETMDRIFDPFFTTKFTGRGLGMAAVLGIVRGHRGAIKAYSEPGKGTTFKMFLPASAGHAGELLRKTTVAQLWQSSGTILLVDDEETIRALGSEMLEMLGFQIMMAEDGRQAVEIYKERQGEIDCVILDLTMPHMDGEEAFRELRRINEDVRVIMSSGYNEQEVSQRFLGKRLTGFIQKPYKLDELSAVLQRVLEP